MSKRRYTDEEKATALVFLADIGGNLPKTSRDTGVPRKTIHEWHDGRRGTNAAVETMRWEKKVDLAARYEEFQHKALPVPEGKIEQASLKDLMTACGIAADKMAKLRGDQPVDPHRTNVFIEMNRGTKGFPLQ